MSVVDDGRGKFDFRIVIEGHRTEYVSHLAMEVSSATASDSVRKAWLDPSNIILDVEPQLRQGKLDAKSFRVTLIEGEPDFEVTADVFRLPSVTTYLTSEASTTDTTLNVESTTGIGIGDVVHIGTEAIRVGTTGVGTLTGCTRGWFNSIAQKHFVEDGTEFSRRAAVTDRMGTWSGRRCFLYVYDETDDPQGDGTLRWRGVIMKAPRPEPDGVRWTFTVDPITSLLAGELGGDLRSKPQIRGIYIPPQFPGVIWVREGSDSFTATYDRSSEDSAFDGGGDARGRISGHFETLEDFADAFTDELARMFAAMGTAFDHAAPRAVVRGPNEWTVEIIKVANRSLSVWYIEGKAGEILLEELGEGPQYANNRAVLDEDGNLVPAFSVSTGALYYERQSFIGGVPRTLFGTRGTPIGEPRDAGTLVEADARRLYLSGPLTGMSALQVTWWTGAGQPTQAIPYAIESLKESDGYAVLVPPTVAFFGITLGDSAYGAWNRLPFIEPARNLHSSAAGGPFNDAINNIVSQSPDFANIGGLPFLTSDDVDTVDLIAKVLVAILDVPWLLNRSYVVSRPIKAETWFAGEVLALGAMSALSSSGKITVVPFRVPTSSEQVVAELNESNVVAEDDDGNAFGIPPTDVNPFGLINTVQLSRGYDAAEDRYTLQPLSIRNLRSWAARKTPAIHKVEPKSASILGDADITVAEGIKAFDPILGFFGSDYAVFRLPVVLGKLNASDDKALIDVLVGDLLRVNLPNVPNPRTGARGLNAVGQCIGTRIDMTTGRGELKVIVHFIGIAGYTPVVGITGNTPFGTNRQTLNVVTTDALAERELFPSGLALSEAFPVGAQVEVIEMNALTPTVLVATIVSVNDAGSTIRIDHDPVSWPFTTEDINLHFREAGNGLLASQKAFAYVAGADGRIPFDSPEDAKVFSP